jgi:HEPN domain-containing protein
MAEEFITAAKESAGVGRWRAAGLNAVHAAISAADSVCILQLKERAAGERHEEAAELLALSGASGAAEKAAQLAAVLDLKSRVEYEARPMAESESATLLKRSQRIVEWAAKVVEAHNRKQP